MQDNKSNPIIRDGPDFRKIPLPPFCFLLTVFISQYGTLALDAAVGSVAAMSPVGVSMFACGMSCMIAVNSWTLYAQKPTEKYLLWMVFLAVMALLRSIVDVRGGSLPGVEFFNIAFDILTIVVNYTLCFLLTDTRLPGKWNLLLRPAGLVLLYGVLLLLRFTMYGTVVQQLASILPYVAALGCLGIAYLRGKPHALLLIIGIAARYGLRGYLLSVNQLDLPEDALYHIVASLRPDFFVFVLICMFVVNGRFVAKFNESDRLLNELDTLNAQLDTKVERRTRELQQANETILQQQRQRQALMTNIFHDLRSPLFVLNGYMDMPQTGDEDSQKRAQVMRERLTFLNRMVEDLFLVAKLEEGAIHFEKAPFQLDAACRQIADAAGAMAEQKQVRVVCSAVPVMYTGDRFRLQQALQNLLENAIQHTPEGGTVTLALEDAGADVQITVTDTGEGIPQEELNLVFDRYYKKPRKSSGSSASGLGLTIVRQIVSAMGGTVHADSRPGEGSTFTALLPKGEE